MTPIFVRLNLSFTSISPRKATIHYVVCSMAFDRNYGMYATECTYVHMFDRVTFAKEHT